MRTQLQSSFFPINMTAKLNLPNFINSFHQRTKSRNIKCTSLLNHFPCHIFFHLNITSIELEQLCLFHFPTRTPSMTKMKEVILFRTNPFRINLVTNAKAPWKSVALHKRQQQFVRSAYWLSVEIKTRGQSNEDCICSISTKDTELHMHGDHNGSASNQQPNSEPVVTTSSYIVAWNLILTRDSHHCGITLNLISIRGTHPSSVINLRNFDKIP